MLLIQLKKQPRIAMASHGYKVIFLDITNISQASHILFYIWFSSSYHELVIESKGQSAAEDPIYSYNDK